MVIRYCNKCGIELTDINWSAAFRDNYDYTCHECRKKHDREWRKNNRQHIRINDTKWHNKIRLDVLSHYSNGTMRCVGLHNHECLFNCSDLRCLTIDHINGGGAKQRRDLKLNRGGAIYVWLKNHNYPKGYQVLCMNCQWIKRAERNECGQRWD